MIFFSRKKQEALPPVPKADGQVLADTDLLASEPGNIVMPPPPERISLTNKQPDFPTVNAVPLSSTDAEISNEEPSDDLDKLNKEIDSLEKEIKDTEANIDRIDKELGKLNKKK